MSSSETHLANRATNCRQKPVPDWLPYLDLACAATAGAAWYLRSEWGPWPLVLVFAPWAVRWLLTGRPTRRTPMELPLTLFLATAGMGVWAAFHKEAAWSKFWIIVGAVAVYYALANQPTYRHLRVFAFLYALFGAGVAAYFFWTNNWIHGKAKIEALTELGKAIQALFPPFSGHQMQPNVVGGMLAMIVPFQLSMLFGDLRKGTQMDADGRRFSWWHLSRGVVAVALVLTAFALLMTTSRGAWLAMGVGMGLWALWKASGLTVGGLPLRRKDTKEDKNKALCLGVLVVNPEHRWRRFLTLAAVVVAMGGAALLLFPGGPQGALALVPGQNQLPDRVSLWQRAVYLIQDTPFTGGGLGSFPALDSAYAYPITDWRRYPVHIWVVNFHSHNLWLDVAVEQGLPGLVALLWLQGAFVATAWRRGRTSDVGEGVDRQGRLLAQAAVVSALVVALHAVVDDVPYGSRAMLLSFVPMGVVVALAPARLSGWRAFRLAIALPAGLLLLGLAALAWRRPLVAAWQADLGALAQARVELAGYLDEGFSLERLRAEGDFAQATERFEAALTLQPEQPAASLRMGLIHLGQGQVERAIPLLEQACRAQPGRQAARQALAEAYLATGRLKESLVLWKDVDEANAKLKQAAQRYRRLAEEARAEDAVWMAEQLKNNPKVRP